MKQNNIVSEMETSGQFFVTAGLFVAFIVVAGLYYFANQDQRLDIRFVRVIGVLEHVEKEEMEQAILPKIEVGYLVLDVDLVRDAVEKLDWVNRVQVQKIWPDTVIVTVKEQIPYARWGENDLLSINGEKFRPNQIARFTSLPLIVGPKEQEVVLLDKLKHLQGRLNNIGITITKLQVNDRLSWSIRLSNGLLVQMGRKQPLLAFERFLTTLPLLGNQQIEAMERVDLRYPNGYAVQWKSGTELEWGVWVNQPADKPDRQVRSI